MSTAPGYAAKRLIHESDDDLLVDVYDLGVAMDYDFTPEVDPGDQAEPYARDAATKRNAATRILRTLDRELESYLRRPPRPRLYTEVITVPETRWVPGMDNPYRTGSGSSYLAEYSSACREWQVLRLQKTPVLEVTRFEVVRRLSGPETTLATKPQDIKAKAGIEATAALSADDEITYTSSTGGTYTFVVDADVAAGGVGTATAEEAGRDYALTGVAGEALARNGADVAVFEGDPTRTDVFQARDGHDYVQLPFGLELYTIYPYDVIDVQYWAGIEDPHAHELFQGIILRAAMREAQNIVDETVGVNDTEPRKIAPLTIGFTQRELAVLAEHRRARI